MIDALLLDTHIAVWLDSGNSQLRPSTRDLIDECRTRGGKIYLSAVSAWELGQLVYSGRVKLDLPVDRWIERFLGQTGVEGISIGHRAASRSYQLHHLEHRDPADRLLIAAAIDLECPLVTYDGRITQFARRWGGQYGFSVVS